MSAAEMLQHPESAWGVDDLLKARRGGWGCLAAPPSQRLNQRGVFPTAVSGEKAKREYRALHGHPSQREGRPAHRWQVEEKVPYLRKVSAYNALAAGNFADVVVYDAIEHARFDSRTSTPPDGSFPDSKYGFCRWFPRHCPVNLVSLPAASRGR
jgi:hypothetical protein